MSKPDPLELAEQLMEKAIASGADVAEVYQVQSQSQPVVFEASSLKQLESSHSQETALRIWRNGCPGLAVAYGRVEPEVLVERAIALAQLQPAETIHLAPPRKLVYPPVGEPVTVEQLVEQGKEAIAQLRAAEPELVCNGSWEREQETTTLINSQGLHCESAQFSVSCELGVEWIRGDDFLEIYDGEYSHQSIAVTPIVERILQRLEWAQQNVSAVTGKQKVLFTPEAATVLWATVEAATDGELVLNRSSPWSEAQDTLVVSPNIYLSQQPQLQPYDCPFDDQGMICQPLQLIQAGRLVDFYTDLRTAEALGVNPTGNGFRSSLGAYPSPDLINLVVEPGDRSFRELVEQMKDGLIVAQILGGGADISGDFSINVDLGYLVSRGEIRGRVKDTMVTGNVYQILKQIVLGGDRVWQGSYFTPSVLAEGISVVAGGV